MGGCNSVWNDVELGGAIVGAGIATVATGGAAAAGFALAAGSAGAYFATKSGCSKDRQAIIRATNEIVATAIVTSINQCNDQTLTTQNVKLTCAPSNLEANTTVYEANSSCTRCIENVFNGMQSQHDLERKLWSKGPAQVRLPINDEYMLLMGRLGTCGMTVCKACTIANVSQANILSTNSSCFSNIDQQASFKTNLSSLLKQQLVNNQDILAGVAKAFGNSNVSNITENLTNLISSKADTNFINSVFRQITSTQNITLQSNGSTTVNNISQINTFNIALQLVSQANIAENSISNDVFQTVAEVANQQNTLNDVGTLVFESTVTFVGAIDSIVGKVMLAALITLGVIVLVIIAYALYRFIKKSVVATQKVAREIELTRMQQSALQQF